MPESRKIISGYIPVKKYDNGSEELHSVSNPVVVAGRIEIGRKTTMFKAFRSKVSLDELDLYSNANSDLCSAQLTIGPYIFGGYVGCIDYVRPSGRKGYMGNIRGKTVQQVIYKAGVQGFVEGR